MKKEHIKSFILILLVINSVQLTVQLWFSDMGYDALTNVSFVGKIMSVFNNDNEILTEEELYKNAVMPRRIVINGGGAREVYPIETDMYITAKSYVDNAITAMKENGNTVQTSTFEEWKNLFKSKSLYVDYGYNFDYNSLNKLYDLKTSQGKFESFLKSSGFVLTPDVVTNTCAITFFNRDDNSVTEHKFRHDAVGLLEFIENSTYGKHQNDTFAFELNLDTSSQDIQEVERVVELSPLALLSISIEPSVEKMITVNNMFENQTELERFAEKTLPVFGYNPSSLRKTVQGDGTIAYVENNATIKYYPDGMVEYNAVSKNNGIHVANGMTDCDSAVNEVLRLVKELWEKSDIDINSFNLHLCSDLRDYKDTRYEVEFNNIYDGKVVNYNRTNSAVKAVVEDGYVTGFTIHFANISENENICEVYPVLSAIDTLYADYGSDTMIIDDVYKCYDVQNYGEIETKWAFKIRNRETVLVIDTSLE